MKLLIFAHRGEAQSFLSEYDFSPVNYFFNGFFKTEHFYLLITGEGIRPASEKTVSILASFIHDIDEVFNFGVAGSLNDKFNKYDLLWIRTAYAHHAESLEFKSFSSHYPEAKTDCITASERILNSNDRTKLSHFANIVDRELWAIASACHLYKLPFSSLKIISDDLKDSPNICSFVKEEASNFSTKLLLEFQKYELNKPKPKISNTDHSFLNDSDFYFTTSQTRKLNSLLHHLALLQIDLKNVDINQIREGSLLPKERTKFLLQALSDKINPIAKRLRDTIDKNLSPLTEAAIHTSYDASFEQDWLKLSMEIKSARDLLKIKNALAIFSYEDFKKKIDGVFE